MQRIHRSSITLDELMALAIPEPNTGCWLWLRGFNWGGYGRVTVGGRRRRAHRLSYELAYGPIPLFMNVCHRCDTPACINPDHLFIGDHSANARDMVAKGRYRGPVAAWRRTGLCQSGHDVSVTGVRRFKRPDGRSEVVCLACQRDRTRKYRGHLA